MPRRRWHPEGWQRKELRITVRFEPDLGGRIRAAVALDKERNNRWGQDGKVAAFVRRAVLAAVESMVEKAAAPELDDGQPGALQPTRGRRTAVKPAAAATWQPSGDRQLAARAPRRRRSGRRGHG